MEEKQMFGALKVYRERGAFLRRLELFQKAKASYDQAHLSTPNDVRMLTGRSQVCADIMLPMQAIADAENALSLEPKNMVARNMQAQAMYTMSEFERSLVMNYRGARYRRQPPYFYEGISQGLETIQDCVGKNAGNVMLDFLPLIKHNELLLAEKEVHDSLHVSRIPKPVIRHKMTQMQTRKHAILSRVLAMKYLGPMAYDKFFLQEISNDEESVQSANTVDSAELKIYINEALRSLSERQEMLHTQRPYYTVKFAEKTDSNHQTKFKEALLIKERTMGNTMSERLLKQIDKFLHNNRIKDMLALAERMQLFLDSKTLRTLPDKELFTDRLYKAVGEGYLSLHRLSYKNTDRGNRRRIAYVLGLPTGRPTSYDSVVANYPVKYRNVKKATESMTAALDICENSMKKCWLAYELTRLLCVQKNYALAKFYGKRCQRKAEELNCSIWWLNGCFALLGGDMQQGNANEVRIGAADAYKWTKTLFNRAEVEEFLVKCVEMATVAVTSNECKAIRQRENEILKVMDDQTRVDTEVLFKQISRIPNGRRFSVLPGRSKPALDFTERRRRRQHGLTIIPGKEKALPSAPRSNLPGFQVFDI